MNSVVFNIIDGTAFFIGLILVVLAQGLFLRFGGKRVSAILTILVIVGMTLAIISGTPTPMWLYAIWITTIGVGRFVNWRAKSLKPRMVAWVVLALMTTGFMLAELPYHFSPRRPIAAGKTIYVIGDSISAGTGGREKPWPVVLGEIRSSKVVNLAKPGATVERAIGQAEAIGEIKAVVIVEIGGNDLLGGTDAALFQSRLETLIGSLAAKGDQIVMFELPLFPLQNGYGAAQRSVAARYGVTLIPKRYFTQVVGSQEGTVDGLHLSQKGHDQMAKLVAGVIAEGR